MKIDIHVHTKKTKQGDSENRNIDDQRLKEIISMTDVKILAITNHNHFDLIQYKSFENSLKGISQVWPGIELDIIEDGKRAHLIVIVNPKNVNEFDIKVKDLLNEFTPDTFTINLEDTVAAFDNLDAIYIPHYHSKKPSLSETSVDLLFDKVSNNKRVLKEATNAISAGIYVSHGHNSIYGSDVHNWHDYQEISKELPDLRLPVASFEQFCLLLEKDNATINTILNEKTKENIQINPFNNVAEIMNIDIYDDINILFGSKGTGKTDILRALSNYYNGEGHKTHVYESSNVKLDDEYDLKGNKFDTTVSEYKIDECIAELESLKNASEEGITNISAYKNYFKDEETNKISKNLKIRDFALEDDSVSQRALEEIADSIEYIKRFKENVEQDEIVKGVIGNEMYDELSSLLDRITLKIKNEIELRFFDYQSISLFNSLIRKFRFEIARKTGQPEKPSTTGFKRYASNRIEIERNLNKILANISIKIPPITSYVGDLGGKGQLHCETNLLIQDGTFTNVEYRHLKRITKKPQKQFANCLSQISKHIYSTDLFEKIAELERIDSVEKVKCLSDLLLFNRHFTLNGKEYTPSNGESSMVLLHNELKEDKNIFIIDEPEKSLGNDYISEEIVPLLKEHAQRGKKIIVATHDANIAVRTLPYNSIYRGHDEKGYFTFTGNPFSNNLVCLTQDRDDLDWKNISMKTLEGGKEAFGERGKIYGNT